MTRLYALTLILLCFCVSLQAQFAERKNSRNYDPETEDVYKVRPLLEGGTGILGLGATAYMFQKINDKDKINLETLDRQDVPGYDRWAFPASGEASDRAAASSDYFFYGSMALPFTLFAIDKNIRHDWIDITSMYFQAQAAAGLIYSASPIGPNFTNRVRPLAYYDEFDFDTRASGKNKNSFFSGHVSTTAVGSYFFAKVLSDYHPEWNGKQRALAFGLATLPPAYVGIQRVRALKHFPSDVVVGYGIGTLLGILTPQLHKRWQQNRRSSLGIGGFYGEEGKGLGLNLIF